MSSDCVSGLYLCAQETEEKPAAAERQTIIDMRGPQVCGRAEFGGVEEACGQSGRCVVRRPMHSRVLHATLCHLSSIVIVAE